MANATSEQICLRLRWPGFADPPFEEEFFLGAWHPTATLSVQWSPPPVPLPVAVRSGRNWFLLSSRASFQSSNACLVHTACDNAPSLERSTSELEALAFRGYLLAPPIHSWSAVTDLFDYWTNSHGQHNGVFAAVRILGGGSLEFSTDAFGIGSLYYRQCGGGLLFATNTRFLGMEGDTTDRVAARTLIQCGSVYGDRTLTESVFRVPAGVVKRFDRCGTEERKWFDLSSLATGTKPVTSAVLREVEDSFQTAIDRCLELPVEGYVLPLSGGDDSRRILAALQSRHVPFQALTVRVLWKNMLDLDAHWASAMAREFAFDHQVVDPPSERYAQLDADRRLLVDGHGIEHTWFYSLHPHLARKQHLVFDGLGGDVFGNTGFGIAECHTLPESDKLVRILELLITLDFERILKKAYWPSARALKEHLADYLTQLPDGNNKADLAFLLLRCRSGPGMCFQRLIPAGRITVYPYFDLDYVQACMAVNPLEKLPPQTLQSKCLESYWREYFRFPGTRRPQVPGALRPPAAADHSWLACYRQFRKEIASGSSVRASLTHKGLILSQLARWNKDTLMRIRWWLAPMLTVAAREAVNKRGWSTDSCNVERESVGGV